MRRPALHAAIGRIVPRPLLRPLRVAASLALTIGLLGFLAASVTSAAAPTASAARAASRTLLDVADDGDANECEHIHLHENSCQFVRDHCGQVRAMGDYLALRYCYLDENDATRAVSYVVMAACLVLMISLMATTADSFFVPSLQFIADRLGLSPAITGITLLAFGNGAPDVFTAIAGVQASDFPLGASGDVILPARTLHSDRRCTLTGAALCFPCYTVRSAGCTGRGEHLHFKHRAGFRHLW